MARISTKSRQIVKARQGEQCWCCGVRGSEWSHRRRRGVGGHPQDCPCNGLWLCHACHARAHANPQWAFDRGIFVTAYRDDPYNVPVQTFMGTVRLDCNGDYHHEE